MKRMFLIVSGMLTALMGFSQIDTSSYPAQRRELMELIHTSGPGKEKACGDFVAVGPKGDLSLNRQQWIEAQKKLKVVFRSMKIVPGSEIVQVYDQKTGVVNFMLEVVLLVDGKERSIKVRRLEVYHHSSTGWCMVAGQGTDVDETIFPVK